MSVLSWMITTPFWLEKQNSVTCIFSTPISHFGCRRYQIAGTLDLALKKREVAALSYVRTALPGEEAAPTDGRIFQLGQIVKAFVKSRTGIEVAVVRSVLIEGYTIVFTPIDSDGVPFYIDPARAALLNLNLGLVPEGYELYSASDLTKVLVEKEPDIFMQLHESVGSPPLALVRSDANPDIPTAQVADWVTARWETGTIAVSQTVFWATRILLAKEFIRLWPDENSHVPIKFGGDVGQDDDRVAQFIHARWLGCEFKTWLDKVLLDLVHDRIPVTRVPLTPELEKIEPTAFAIPDVGSSTLMIRAYSRKDLNAIVEELGMKMGSPISTNADNVVETRAPILIGKTGYSKGEWYVDLGDGRTQTLALWETDQPEIYLEKFGQTWVNARYVTAWGHYLYKYHGIVSVYFTQPYRTYQSKEDFELNFLGLDLE